MPRGARAIRLRKHEDEALGLSGHRRGRRRRRGFDRLRRPGDVLRRRAGADLAFGLLLVVAPRRDSLILFGRGFNAHRHRSGGGLGGSSFFALHRLARASSRPLPGSSLRGLRLARSLGRRILLSGPPVVL